MEITERNLPNTGLVEGKLPEEIIQNFWKLIEESKKKPDDMKKELAGNINSSIRLDGNSKLITDFMKKILPSFIDKHIESYGSPLRFNDSKVGFNLEKLWVNFQKKHEFNPPHDHSGLFSFVIWMKIPTSYEKQRKLPIASESNADTLISNFAFTYTDILGKIKTFAYNMEKEAEGYMVVFPAQLYHQVFPFYESKGERVSISGNIGVVTQ